MKQLLFAFLLFVILQIHAQKIIFLGENLTNIDSISYHKKCTRTIVDCVKYKYNKDTIVYAIRKKYVFNKFLNKKIKLIEHVLNDGKKLERRILVKSHDSIALITDLLYRANYKVVSDIKDEKNNITLEIKKKRYTKESFTITNNFLKKHQLFLDKKKRCLKKLHKKEIDVIYRTDKGFIKLYPKVKIYDYKHDSLQVFDFMDPIRGSIIVRPNSQYFKFRRGITKNKLNKILKAKKWNKYKVSLDESLNQCKDGFFDNMHYTYGSYTCF